MATAVAARPGGSPSTGAPGPGRFAGSWADAVPTPSARTATTVGMTVLATGRDRLVTIFSFCSSRAGRARCGADEPGAHADLRRAGESAAHSGTQQFGPAPDHRKDHGPGGQRRMELADEGFGAGEERLALRDQSRGGAHGSHPALVGRAAASSAKCHSVTRP